MKTCIIDDDPIFVFGTKRLINEIGFSTEITVYENGEDAIHGFHSTLADNEPLPNVVLLDLNMPIMNGWEFLDEFISIPNPSRDHVLIYVISSSVDPRDLAKVKEYSEVSNYILKPITIPDLKDIINTISRA